MLYIHICTKIISSFHGFVFVWFGLVLCLYLPQNEYDRRRNDIYTFEYVLVQRPNRPSNTKKEKAKKYNPDAFLSRHS